MPKRTVNRSVLNKCVEKSVMCTSYFEYFISGVIMLFFLKLVNKMIFVLNLDRLLRRCLRFIICLAQCDQVTLLRKGYVQKIALKTVSRQQSIHAQFSDYKHLFECLLLIGLNLDTSNNKVPYIKMKYPANTNVPQCIEHLCFPDAHEWSNDIEMDAPEDDQNNSSRYYTVTVTTEGGQRKYVYCIRLRPEGGTALLPLSYCILSSHKANEFYFRILEEVEARHGKTEVEFFSFVRELYGTRFPTLGGGIVVHPSVEQSIEEAHELIIKRSSDSRLEDLNLARTLEYMKVNVFLLIFSSMLLERKVILLSSSISKLSSCIEGLQTALLPFEWQHTLITVVPSTVISINDLCEAPTPYLIGLLKPTDNSQILPTMNNIQQVIVVDIDEQKVLKKVGDEQSILPKHLTIGLKNALQLAHSSETQTNNLLACEAFTRLFVELLNNYRRYIIRGNLDQRMTIQKEAFLRITTTHSIRMFLEWFVETAAFSAFVETHSYSTESRKLFEKRLVEYEYELNKLKHAKNNKMLKTVKQIGDFFKDLTIAP